MCGRKNSCPNDSYFGTVQVFDHQVQFVPAHPLQYEALLIYGRFSETLFKKVGLVGDEKVIFEFGDDLISDGGDDPIHRHSSDMISCFDFEGQIPVLNLK